jgi:hypothetical protein
VVEKRLLAWMVLLGLVMVLSGLLWPRWEDRLSRLASRLAWWWRYAWALHRLANAQTVDGKPVEDLDVLREQARREASQ